MILQEEEEDRYVLGIRASATSLGWRESLESGANVKDSHSTSREPKDRIRSVGFLPFRSCIA